ncbi:MAG: lipid-A-disaccharide synthase [Candidatus Omnitrophica bacterium]|nr:lipid-A-disaccharide synthase [Candidatus Omnitrophota bacterium]
MNILIVAGEPSGDLHASNLVKDLRSMQQGLSFFGLGGELSKEAGVEVVFDISKLALVGAVEVVKNIATVGKAYKAVMSKIDAQKPDLAILVDYPGFNLRLAKALKKRSIPVVYYISPQIWAWGFDRIEIIKRCVKKMVVFFKFEEELYKKYGVDAEFVGHPLVDIVKMTLPRDDVMKAYDLLKGKKTITLLPGSRSLEVKSFLPVMLSAAGILNDKLKGAQFIIARHPGLPLSLYEEAIGKSGLDARIATSDTYNIVGASDFAIVASGTATLETAMIGTPFVLMYKASFITYLLYKAVMRSPFLGLANIIAGKEVAPEFLQYDATPEKIAAKAFEIIEDAGKMAAMRSELQVVKTSLGGPGARMRAAKAILPLLS